MNNSKIPTVVLHCTKPDTQAQIKSLRAAGLTVHKDSSGLYRCNHYAKNSEGVEECVRLFMAMPGRNGYLVRRTANLFS